MPATMAAGTASPGDVFAYLRIIFFETIRFILLKGSSGISEYTAISMANCKVAVKFLFQQFRTNNFICDLKHFIDFGIKIGFFMESNCDLIYMQR